MMLKSRTDRAAHQPNPTIAAEGIECARLDARAVTCNPAQRSHGKVVTRTAQVHFGCRDVQTCSAANTNLTTGGASMSTTPHKAHATWVQEWSKALQLWFKSWLGRCGLHVPWVACALAYWNFVTSGQGLSAMQVPVQHPYLAQFGVGAFLGACLMLSLILAVSHAAHTRTPLRVVVHWKGLHRFMHHADKLAHGVFGQDSQAGKSQKLVLGAGVFLQPVILSALCFGPQTSVAEISGADGQLAFLTGFCGLGVGAAVVSATLSLPSLGEWRHQRLVMSLTVIAIPTAISATGFYLVTHRLDFIVGLGPTAVVAAGMLTLALHFQAVLIFALRTSRPALTFALPVALVLVHLNQTALPDRPNPLLKQTPPPLAHIESECAKSVDGNKASDSARETDGKAVASSAHSAIPQDPRKQPAPTYLISAEGGGIRAAFWTAVSLEYLSQSLHRPILSETEVLSGVSGGSLGVTAFVAAQELPLQARLPCIKEFLSSDFLTPLVAGLLFVDVPRLILPVGLVDTHRGDYFEEYMANRWTSLTGRRFFAMPLKAAAGGPVSGPALFFNATDALSGRRVPLANVPSPSSGAASDAAGRRLTAAVERALPGLTIAQAVHTSARFTYLSPAPDLVASAAETSKVLAGIDVSGDEANDGARLASLVDGGYFDNSALAPTLAVLEAEATQAPKRAHIIVHVVNDQSRSCADAYAGSGCTTAARQLIASRLSPGRLAWLLRPLQAIEASRAQHSTSSLAALEMAVKLRRETEPPLLLRTLQLPLPPLEEVPPLVGLILDLTQQLPLHGRDPRYETVALGWVLAPVERDLLLKHAKELSVSGGPRS
jgi:hypothetical protein